MLGMRIHQEEFEHPTQASRVLLNVYEQQVGRDVAAADDEVRGVTGYLVTEDRLGSSRVVATLGFFKTREDALGRVRGRGDELKGQRYRPVPSAA
jgi:hypothetical protein